MRWLRGIKKRVFKKHGNHIGIDGVYYRPDSYDKMLKEFLKVKIGDPIFNHYKNKWDAVKEVSKEWVKDYHYNNVRVLEVTIITESGYIIYDIYDCEPGRYQNE